MNDVAPDQTVKRTIPGCALVDHAIPELCFRLLLECLHPLLFPIVRIQVSYDMVKEKLGIFHRRGHFDENEAKGNFPLTRRFAPSAVIVMVLMMVIVSVTMTMTLHGETTGGGLQRR